MENKFTPGKWVRNNCTVCIESTLNKVAVCYELDGPDGNKAPIEEMRANAKLIAAAPELLEALQKLTEQVTKHCSIGSDPVLMEMLNAHQQSLTAIKKATE